MGSGNDPVPGLFCSVDIAPPYRGYSFLYNQRNWVGPGGYLRSHRGCNENRIAHAAGISLWLGKSHGEVAPQIIGKRVQTDRPPHAE
jgi:hypothetical protein